MMSTQKLGLRSKRYEEVIFRNLCKLCGSLFLSASNARTCNRPPRRIVRGESPRQGKFMTLFKHFVVGVALLLNSGCNFTKYCKAEYWEHSCPEEGHGPCFICDK